MSKEIPKGWKESTLGEVAKFIMGQSPTSDTYNSERVGLPFFQGKADFGYKYPQVRYWCSRPTKIVEQSSILFSVRAPVGEVNVSPYTCCIGRGLAGIQAVKADHEFLFQKLQYLKPRFQLLSQGSTFEAVNGSDLREFDLVVPPINEQKKIAIILSSVDDVIEKTRVQIDKLKDLKTGMMQELLTKGIGHTGFKDSPIGLIPISWDIKTLNEISERIWIGLVTTMTKHYVPEGTPLIRNSDIKEFSFRNEAMIKLAHAFSQQNISRSFELGDVATVHTGDVGTSAVIDKSLIGAQGFATLNTRVNRELMTPEFLCEMLNSSILGGQIKKVVTGDGRDNLNLKDFVQLKLPLPSSLTEQVEIHNAIHSVRTRIHSQTQKLKVLTSIKKALMQDLLTGKVRVNVENHQEEKMAV